MPGTDTLLQSHSLWYTSSRGPAVLPGLPDGLLSEPGTNGHNPNHHPRQRGQILERTTLARLAADETYIQRRRLNVQNYGSGWLKPPGVPKTLHQMREEKREQEEHQEALRREQLAQELADAEAEAAGMEEEDGMDDVQLDGAQDLDDEIPDADDDFALGAGSSDEEEEEDDANDEEAVEQDDDAIEAALREERRNDLMTARMRMTDDAFREALVRGDPDGEDMYGGAEERDEQDRGHMLDEEDFGQDGIVDDPSHMDDADLGMDADLDDDVPEADEAGYEHTDSDADLSSDEEEDDSADDGDVGFAPRAAPLGPPQSPTLRARNRRSTGAASAPRSSMDLSAFLSQDESSFMDSSPAQARWNRRG
ncbi:hypothetical protein K4F52_001628 [Lecanicillium sp. MT-2017a]|nr:hypothetical protein K4F52_001628 [Lecanicillium sp. MT-2017a]